MLGHVESGKEKGNFVQPHVWSIEYGVLVILENGEWRNLEYDARPCSTPISLSHWGALWGSTTKGIEGKGSLLDL